jgi:hypothetical protein
MYDILKLMITNSRKSVLTADNRQMAFGLHKLRGGVEIHKPVALKKPVQEVTGFNRRRHNDQIRPPQ